MATCVGEENLELLVSVWAGEADSLHAQIDRHSGRIMLCVLRGWYRFELPQSFCGIISTGSSINYTVVESS